MLDLLTRSWWVLALRGLLAVIFGVLALFWPQPTLEALIIFFAIYALVDGFFTMFTALSHRRLYPRWGRYALGGLLSIVVGILTLIWPSLTALLLLYFIAVRAIISGVSEIVAAIELRREIEGELLLGLGGLLSIIAGVVLIIWPGSGALAVVWLIGIYAILLGGVLIALAFRVKSWRDKHIVPGTA